MESDPFDELLGLEEQFYQEGYELGVADGSKAGRIEGRVFGLEKGFDKFTECGRLYGRSIVWTSRLPESSKIKSQLASHAQAGERTAAQHLPVLPANQRLEKNIIALSALAEPASLSTDNTDDAVTNFDDRLKRAKGKFKIIDRMVREDVGQVEERRTTTGERNIEEINVRLPQ